MKAAGEGVTDGNLNQGGSWPDSGDETATNRAQHIGVRTPFATLVIAGKWNKREGEGEEAIGGAIGTENLQNFNY